MIIKWCKEQCNKRKVVTRGIIFHKALCIHPKHSGGKSNNKIFTALKSCFYGGFKKRAKLSKCSISSTSKKLPEKWEVMISFQYFAHLFLLMCNLPTTGIFLDGLLCHFIIIFLSSIPTYCTPQVIQSLVLVCLPNPANATFNIRPPRIPENYVIPRFIC